MRLLFCVAALVCFKAGHGFVVPPSKSFVGVHGSSSLRSSTEQDEVVLTSAALGGNDNQLNGDKLVVASEQDAEDSSVVDIDIESIKIDGVEYGGYSINGYTSSSVYHNSLKPFHYEDEVNEDGYGDMLRQKSKRSRALELMKVPFHALRRIANGPKTAEPGALILVRHGESVWNANKTFTGWADPDLSENGVREVEHAARLLLEGGWEIDLVFTSRLKRAIRSAWIILQELNEVYLPVFKSWRLNERFYGALTGLSKTETADKLGSELVQQWRGSLRTPPPAISKTSPFWPGSDRKYADLRPEQLPETESLLCCMERTFPVWEDKILYELKQGRNVMVVAHANTLRGLVKIIDNIGDEEIQEVAIPTGIPIIYKFNKDMKPIRPSSDQQTASQVHMNGLFLEKPGLLKEALAREEEWAQQVPGYNSTLGRNKVPMTALERSLFKLKAERELGQWAGQFIDPSKLLEDDGNDGNMGKPIQLTEDEVWTGGLGELDEADQFDSDFVKFHPAETEPAPALEVIKESRRESSIPIGNIISNLPSPCIKSYPTERAAIRRDSVIVMIRHGKTEHNKLGLFTGWEDAPLAKEGVMEAKEAGRLLKSHGFEFDVVYTSWLSRAIETAWLVLDEMDCLWLPIIKSWRLNERMYGELTGLSKQMVKQRHGKERFTAWRRGYKTRPPAVSSFSQHYPGNDSRYTKYLNDARWSLRESLIRSIGSGKLEFHRKFPKAESLKDCMERTIPFFTERITPEAIAPGKRVLISSSENAIRGLLMHLCEIPEDKITGLEIPNGLPLVFDLKSRCLKLLDDGTGQDPLEIHNFGSAAKYLFRPCKNADGSVDEECDITYSSPLVLSEEEKNALAAIRRQPVQV